MKLCELEEILNECWDKSTSSDPDKWTPENPAWGQCAVTSVIVQDYFGGEIVWAEVNIKDNPKYQKPISHYFNNIQEREIDLTRKQFPPETYIPKGIEKKKEFPTTRDYVLSYEPTMERYLLLKERVEKFREYENNKKSQC